MWCCVKAERGTRMKSKSLNILLVSLLLLGLMSVMLIVFLIKAHEDFPHNITVSADGKTETVLEVRQLRLSPTEKKEYSVNLVCDASGSYHIYLDFLEIADGGMKDFVNVTVKCAGFTVYEGDLKSLLDGEVVTFDGVLESDDPLAVTICYEMPYEIGNEAQGTSADFDVRVRIKKS